MVCDKISYTIFNDLFANSADSLLIYNTIFNALRPYSDNFKTEFDSGSPQSHTSVLFKEIMAGDIDRRTIYKIINCQNSVPVKDVWVDLFQI